MTPETQSQAMCAGLEDPDVMFPDPTDYAGTTYAKSLCAQCPIAVECLETAMADSDLRKWGVWGGTTPEERKTMMRNDKTRLRIIMETKASSDRAKSSIRKTIVALPSYNENNPFSQK